MFDLSDLGSLGKLAKQMEDAYSDGMSAMNQAGEQVAQDINPDHEIQVSIELKAQVQGHKYHVEAEINFDIELEPILQAQNSPMGDLSSVLDGLDVDLGDDKEAVMEQLGQPRAIGVVKKIKLIDLKVSNKKGPVQAQLNKKATILATLKDSKLSFNFEGVFTYPDQTDLFIAVPSMEKMQKNIIIDLNIKSHTVKFKWIEKDKDNLQIQGSLTLKKK